MKLIFLNEKQHSVVTAITPLRKGTGIGAGSELVLDTYNLMALITYPFGGIKRSVPWVHFLSNFFQHGDGLCSLFFNCLRRLWLNSMHYISSSYLLFLNLLLVIIIRDFEFLCFVWET